MDRDFNDNLKDTLDKTRDAWAPEDRLVRKAAKNARWHCKRTGDEAPVLATSSDVEEEYVVLIKDEGLGTKRMGLQRRCDMDEGGEDE